MSLKQLFAWLFGLTVFRVGPGDEGGGPGDEEGGEGEEEGAGEEGDAGTEDEGDGEDAGDEGDSRAANIKALRDKAKRNEAQAQTERDGRIAAEARLSALEARMNSNGAPKDDLPADADATQRFVHEGNKAIKAVTEKVNYATLKAEDAGDKAEFYSQAQDDPLINKYRVRVEAKLQEMLAKGNRAPREAIMTFLIGEDVRKGKGPKAQPSKAAQEAAARVKRASGEPARARSDAGGKSKPSDADARKKRLTGQFI